MIAALALLLGLAQSEQRVAFLEVELEGPLAGTVLDLGPAGRTLLEGDLARLERRTLVVPVPTLSGVARTLPRVEIPPLDPVDGGHVRLHGWAPSLDSADIPAGLGARPWPTPPESRVRAGTAALALVAGAFVLGISLRRKLVLALAVGVVFAGLTFLLAPSPSMGAPRVVEVVDGTAGSEIWLRTRGAQGSLALAARDPRCILAVEPSDAPIVVHAPLDATLPCVLVAPAARLYERRVEHWPADALAPERNDLVDLSETWVREEGTWTAHGAWPRGASLPAERPGPPPPAWLASGLPQGVRIVLARESASDGREAWVRAAWP